MNENGNSTSLHGDNPIRDKGDDVLERADVADAFALDVLVLDAKEGATVGVFGPWGSGKTSFINLARTTFERKGVPVLEFNPWLFSGAEQLVERFFAELSASMGMKDELKEIGEAFSNYGTAFNALAGAASAILAMPQIATIVKEFMATANNVSQPESIDTLRRRIKDALRKRDKPIVVVLDDVDRLSAPEIREVFKLVRLTASFPKLIYIVACDRHRIEQALGEQGLPGRDYLEKIIQWTFNLPEVPIRLLTQQLCKAIENAIADIKNPGPFDEGVWADVSEDIVRPLMRNMRDVRRFAIAIRGTVRGLEGQVALADVLALEAIRVFLPDVFRCLPGAIDGLTVMSQAVERRLDRVIQQNPADPITGFNKQLKAQVDGLIAVAEKDRELDASRTDSEVVDAMVDLLFPVGARLRQMSEGDNDPYVNEDAAEHLRERRVAHESILRLYLERLVAPDLLASHDAMRALARMTDGGGMYEFIRSLEPTRWQDVVSNLYDLAVQFRPKHVEPGIVVLLNLWPDMPERPSNSRVLGNDTRGTVRKATLRLLRILEDAAAVEAAVHRILPKVTSLSSKVELVLQVGYREKSGHKLVSEKAASEFETMLQNTIRGTSADDLAEEREPLRVLVFARNYGGLSEEVFDVDESSKLTFALLRSVRGGVVTDMINWQRLIDLYGSAEVLATRINDLKVQFESLKPWFETCGIPLDEAERLLDLADTYLSSWGPDAD